MNKRDKMNLINFRSVGEVSRSSINLYRIDDPTGDSIFGATIPEEQNRIHQELLRPIIWDEFRPGMIDITYDVIPSMIRSSGIMESSGRFSGLYIRQNYSNEQLKNGYDLLGAIYTFYNDPITPERIRSFNFSGFDRYDFERYFMDSPDIISRIPNDKRRITLRINFTGYRIILYPN